LETSPLEKADAQTNEQLTDDRETKTARWRLDPVPSCRGNFESGVKKLRDTPTNRRGDLKESDGERV